MKIIDISWPISPAMTGYKDKNEVSISKIKDFAKDAVRETSVTIGCHAGTHIDAAAHFLKDGKTIDELDLSRCIGQCRVVDMPEVVDGITRDAIIKATGGVSQGEIILFKTVNSDKNDLDKFDPHFVYLEKSGAQYLADQKVKAVGIDYLGIERIQPDHDTHKTLMQADVVVVEGLRLAAVAAGTYLFVCLPLYIIGVEAAPARAILVQD